MNAAELTHFETLAQDILASLNKIAEEQCAIRRYWDAQRAFDDRREEVDIRFQRADNRFAGVDNRLVRQDSRIDRFEEFTRDAEHRLEALEARLTQDAASQSADDGQTASDAPAKRRRKKS
jgi:hypothetical protein